MLSSFIQASMSAEARWADPLQVAGAARRIVHTHGDCKYGRVTVRADILTVLRSHPEGLSDAALAATLGKRHQHINQTCRWMGDAKRDRPRAR